MKLEEAIQQKKFPSEEVKASINILFTSSWLQNEIRHLLLEYDISWQQYNILRILRGSHPVKMTTKDICSRMIDRMSNTSRLVDKLVQKGLVEQHRCPEDRRRVDISITKTGIDTAVDIGEAIEKQTNDLFSSLDSEESKLLNYLLDKLRLNKK